MELRSSSMESRIQGFWRQEKVQSILSALDAIWGHEGFGIAERTSTQPSDKKNLDVYIDHFCIMKSPTFLSSGALCMNMQFSKAGLKDEKLHSIARDVIFCYKRWMIGMRMTSSLVDRYEIHVAARLPSQRVPLKLRRGIIHAMKGNHISGTKKGKVASGQAC
jgi:hypothetical protein